MRAWLRGNDGFRLTAGVWLLVALVVAIASATGPALAQTTYPTAAGATSRVQGVVPLQCNASGAACAPVTASNPAGPNQVVGNVASGATDSGNPVKAAGKYLAAAPTFTDGQRGDLQIGAQGQLNVQIWNQTGSSRIAETPHNADNASQNVFGIDVSAMGFNINGAGSKTRTVGDTNGTVVQPALPGTYWQYAAVSGGIVSSTADVAVKAAGGASVRNYVCGIDISHDALASASELVIKDGAATVLWRTKLQTAAVDGAAGAGKIVFTPCLRGTANTAVNVAMLTSTTGGVFVNVSGYTGS